MLDVQQLKPSHTPFEHGSAVVTASGIEVHTQPQDSLAPLPSDLPLDQPLATPPSKARKVSFGGALRTPAVSQDSAEDVNDGAGEVDDKISPSIVVPLPTTPASSTPSLVVSDSILGLGSHGTVVFKGSLQGRAVAVKRLLQDFVTLASREVSVLQESDDHPNVIRYYYQEAHANFLYIALELCPASLADIIERPDQFRDISISFDPKRALRQITAGLRHLHALKIIHRDIKPPNILVSHAKKGVGESAGHRMLISDFGLCKKLEVDQTSFYPTAHGAMAAGTVGWRAPEIIRGDVTIDGSGGEDSQSSRGSAYGSDVGTPTGRLTRLTKSVDVFALGCLFYYVLTNGGHPFGDRYERDVNILKNAKCLDGLERFGEEGSDAVDLITKMLDPEASRRPDTSTCLLHPYFWDPGKRLGFLQDASDRFEVMCRDPRDPLLVELERGAISVVGNDWNTRLDKWFIDNLGKYRKYDGKSVQDLMRALRNKKHHYQDLPDNVKRQIGTMPEGFLLYFTRRFPRLFLHVHSVVSSSQLRSESMFRSYFELAE
ncbi:kinase-like domain-containing protein [Cytidiella melzeri]|nr:kinase-like domain-containing protein [Cytidiella melzeri]